MKKSNPTVAKTTSAQEDAYQLLDIDVKSLPESSARLASVKKLILAASLLATAPAAMAATNSREVNNPKTTETASLVTNSALEAEALANQVTADPSQKSTLNIKNIKGVSVVDINAPNAAGVSDNRFSSFSTNKGVVFKNNTIEINSKVLKQKLAKNPNLREEAKVILAQVTGHDKSIIKGTLEVLGKNKADLLIINPNGIDLNGVALANVKDFTAATAEVSANNAESMRVTQGTITVSGDLTTDDVNMLKLIAQAVQIKAKIAPSKKYKGKKADILVSGGKQKFNHKTNTAQALEDLSSSTNVAISGSELGSMYGNQIKFLVSETGAGVDYGANLLADDNIEINASGDVAVKTVASRKAVKVTSRDGNVRVKTGANAQTPSALMGNEVKLAAAKTLTTEVNTVVSGTEKVELSAENLDFNSAIQSAGTTVLEADTLDLSKGKVVSKDLVVKAPAANITTGDKEQVKAETVSLDLRGNGKVATLADLIEANDFADKVTANHKSFLADDLLIEEDGSFSGSNLNTVALANSFVNKGKLNFSRRSFQGDEGQAQGSVESLVLSAGKSFSNFGLLLADSLNLNAEEVTLDGDTVLFADSVIDANTISQGGNLSVEGDLRVVTKSYAVSGNIQGEIVKEVGKTEELSHYADHALRRDLYQITTTVGKLNLDTVSVSGGELKVKGDLTIEGKEGATDKLFHAKNADVLVGKNMTVKGDLYNTVDTLGVATVDLLKTTNDIVFKFQPRTWINTALMKVKEQKFKNLYEMFQSLFGNNDKFSWHNGAYKIRAEYVLDTFREALNDKHSKQLFSSVFGADWRYLDFATMKARWNEFLASNSQVNAYAPGGQIVVGENFSQSGGNFYTGTEGAEQAEDLRTYENKHFSFQAVKGNVDTQKIRRSFYTDEAIEKLMNEGSLTRTVRGTLTTATQAPDLSSVESIRDVLALDANTSSEALQALNADNSALALLLLEEIKTKAGNYFLQKKSPAQMVNDFLRDAKDYHEKKADLEAWLKGKLEVSSARASKIYREQYEERLKNLDRSYSKLTLVEINGVVAPRLEFSGRLQAKIDKYNKQAANLHVHDNLEVNNAESVVTNNALLTADNAVLVANKVKLSGHYGEKGLEANSTRVRTKDFTLEGSASLGNLDLEAETATFASKGNLNDEGYLVHEGNVDVDSARVQAGKLVFDGAKFSADQDATFTAKAIDLHAKHDVISTYETHLLAGAIGTGSTHKLMEKVKGSEISAANLNVATTEGDLTLQSSALNGKETLNVAVEGNLESSAAKGFTATETHDEKISLDANAGVTFADYGAGVEASLITNEGKAKVNPKLQKEGAGTFNGPKAGINFSYESKDTKVEETEHLNSALNSKAATVVVKENAELGNLDLNSNLESGEDASLSLKAHTVTTNNGQDIREEETSSAKFALGLNTKASSVTVDRLADAVYDIKAVTVGQDVTPGKVLGIISDLGNLVVTPDARINTELSIGGEWSKSNTKVEADSRNTYKGNVAIEAGKVALKSLDGRDLKDLTVKAETISIEGGTSKTESSANTQKFALHMNVDANFDKGGPKVSLGTGTRGKFDWTSKKATNIENTEIVADNVNLQATDVSLVNTKVEAQNAVIDSKFLEVESQQDHSVTKTTGFGFDVGGSASFSPTGAVTGAGKVTGSFNRHVEKVDAVAKGTEVKANHLEVTADEARLTGAVLEAVAEADFEVRKAIATDLVDTKNSDGGYVDLGATFSEKGFGKFLAKGGRNSRYHYEANRRASFLGLTDDNKPTSVDGELNYDAEKALEVTKDESVRSTTYTLDLSKESYAKLKEDGLKALETGKKLLDKLKDLTGASSDSSEEASSEDESTATDSTDNTTDNTVVNDADANESSSTESENSEATSSEDEDSAEDKE